jgi:hypothetical protein
MRELALTCTPSIRVEESWLSRRIGDHEQEIPIQSSHERNSPS